jgi:hypothetical protein
VAMSLALFVTAAYQLYEFTGYFQMLQENRSEIDNAVQRKAALDIQYKKEVKRKEDLGFDIQLIQSSLMTKAALDSQRVDALDLFHRVGYALGRDMRMDKITILRSDKKINVDTSNNEDPNAAKPVLYSTTLRMSFPSTLDAEQGNKEVEKLQSRIQKMMPSSSVRITKLLEDYKYSEELVVQAGNVEKSPTPAEFIAEIRIEKKME